MHLLQVTHGFIGRSRQCGLCVALILAFTASAQNSPDWSKPIPPHHVVGNVYYVGSTGLACYLITTPQGHFLINSGLESTPPLIQTSVEKLGFKFSDIKSF